MRQILSSAARRGGWVGVVLSEIKVVFCPTDDATCCDRGRDTLYPWTGLSTIKSVIVRSHGCRFA